MDWIGFFYKEPSSALWSSWVTIVVANHVSGLVLGLLSVTTLKDTLHRLVIVLVKTVHIIQLHRTSIYTCTGDNSSPV